MRSLWLRVRYILLLVWIAEFLTGCSNTKYLTKDQVLLRKNDVSIRSAINYRMIKRNIEENFTLEGKLASLAKQQPNKKTLGIFKLNLTIYNRFYTDKDSGFYHWIITTIGEPPVLFDSTTMPQSAEIMNSYMISKGYLLSKIDYDYKIRRQKATPRYYVTPGPLYTIDSVFFPTDSSKTTSVIDSSVQNTLLKPGDVFDADVLSNEQLRLFREFLNNGYYHFKRNYIYFEADTSNTRRTANIYVRMQSNVVPEDTQQYYVDNIFVYPNYDPEEVLESSRHDTILFANQYFIDSENTVKPEVLAGAIFISSGALYSRKEYDFSLNRLADLGVFKFISIRFDEKPGNLLDCQVLLTPAKKHAMTAEVEASNIEDNVGGAVKLSFKDKNVFHAANQLDISLNAGTQIPVLNKDSLIFNVTGQLNFYFPRFVLPFKGNFSPYIYPRTKVSLIANYYQQTKIYVLNSYSFTFGYEWKESTFKRHILNPFSLSYVNSTILSQEFQDRLDTDPFLKQSFEDQLIAGINYTFLFSNQEPIRRKNFTFFRISGEVAGTTLYLLNKAITNNNLDATGHYSLFGTNYANFFRIDADVRHYFRFTQNRSLIVRLAAGEAINYWNSDAVPYVKQFYLGGTSSMRAWRVRSLGPGSYEDTLTSSFFNSAGDIKLEANLEYRFNIFGRMKGGAFIDAGNIWLRKMDVNKPGANFAFDRFIDEIAIGTGLGLRFDFTYFVLRLDIATPVRDPTLPLSERWVIDDFTLRGTGWKDNLLFNLAIGYPF